ncbi:MAG: DNA internalization-related competence protein ComEC/Rec2 [Desulfobacterales bacterium]|uniref:DNA internalization-related competence protein ComEC/Rec2 n=1 Tax=Candidatus Desulfatibia profunda TaxID=2841695 RepID=A0A8J6NLS9_9BACT|nr:DNA internalization-related competence protein ComEC/Rec2 [Candidatus Desulfatibia profunda]MBL7180890.1 DNA internalization-related competence protein ComEC/Rec2 [Desulfobacterales bacterium]
MTATIYFRPVIPLLLALVAGTALGFWFPGHAFRAGLLTFLCIAGIVFAVARQKAARILPLVLFTALGYLSIQPWLTPKFPPSHVIHFADTHPLEIAGVIDNDPAKTGNRAKFILRVETLRAKDTYFPATGKIGVTASGSIPELFRGDRVSLVGKIRSIKNFNNPGGFDYKRYMAFKGVQATAYVSGEKLALFERDVKKGIGHLVDHARRSISNLIERTTPADSMGVLKALIIGDKNSISPDLREVFNRAGVGHLLAISGLHIGIVASAAFFFFVRLLSYCKGLLWRAWTKKAAVVLAAIPVLAYGLLAGMSPSTQRAVIMVVVFLMGFLFEREHDPMNTLALAALLILIVDPPSLFSISFQLSFTAVLVIIYGLSCLPNPWKSDPLARQKPRFLPVQQKLFYFLAASFLAITGTMPLSMLYFNQVSLVGLAANVIVVPLIGFLVVPMGLLGVFLYPLTVSGAFLFFKAGTAVLSQALGLVKFFAGLPYAAVKTVTPTYVEICLFYLLLWALLNLTRSQSASSDPQHISGAGPPEQNVKQGEKPGSIFSSQRCALIIVTIVIIAGSADAVYWLNRRFWHNDLRVTVIDVGHGSATLLELPGGHTMLIDGGGFSDNAIFDIGARIVAPLLWRKKIQTVDTLILSHPNSDHLNGLIYIAEHFKVKNAWTNNQAANTIGYNLFMAAIEKGNIQHAVFKTLPRFHEINGVCFDILYPPVDFAAKSKQEWWRDLNNNSLVIKVRFGSKSFLFPGDIKARAETELVAAAGEKLQSTVLLAPHHGSKTSNTEPFLDKINPEVVIISSGQKSRFGFPHQPVLDRYRKRGFRIFNTGLHGAVIMTTDGRSLTVRPTVID